jgi:hypothetical protein
MILSISNIKYSILILLVTLFSGIYMGATSVREKTINEKINQSRIVNNCMEVLTGRKDLCK